MKIYPNDLCPCGSGKKYKNCCKNKTYKESAIMLSDNETVVGILPYTHIDEDADFFVNKKGAVVFIDETKQPILEIQNREIIKTVLSVGFSKKQKPMVTIQEYDGAICYILPDWYLDWCQTCVGMSRAGMNMFPAKVRFSRQNDNYSVDIL